MKTSAEYLALAQRYRIAKLSTPDVSARDLFETFEQAYFLLSKTAQILARSRATRRALASRHVD